jgi:hypothetical protein
MEQVLADQLAAQHGMVSRAWLRHHGFSSARMRTMLETGLLIEVHRAIYRAACAPITEPQQIVGLALRYDAAASHATAGRMWGLRKLGPNRGVEVSVCRARRPDDSDISIHATRDLKDRDLFRRRDGVVVTRVPRTVFDLAARLRPDALESIIEQCLAQKLCTFADLVEVGEWLGQRGRKGSARFAEVLGSRDGKARPVASDYEMRFTQAWEAAGLPPLVVSCCWCFPAAKKFIPTLLNPRAGSW